MKELLETGAAADLEYCEGCDALVGKIGELAVAIKENAAARSYGCLIWVGATEGAEPGVPEKYLSQLAAEKPHIIKNYKAAGRGAAIALVKYNDAERNIGNINKIMTEISDGLTGRGYVSCCYKCGRTDKLSIYSDKGVPVQYCDDCARGTVLRSFGGQDVPIREAPIIAADDPSLGGLLADGSEEQAAEAVQENVINTDDNADLSSLMFDGGGGEQTNEAPRSELFEAAQREYEEEQRREAEANADAVDDLLGSLMFVADEEAPEPAAEEAPAAEEPANETDISELDGLMFDGSESGEEEKKAGPEPAPDPEAFGNANLDNLMFDENAGEDVPPEEWKPEMQDPAALGSEIDGLMVGEADEVTAVTAIGRGQGEDLVIETQDEEYVGIDENIAVTEIHDDSNDGEDIDITATEYDIGAPTDTSGEELLAGDTPLEADGSVPLVNPNSGFADIRPSSAFGPGAVRAYSAGSYDNATAADEPVGFDGRPKGAAAVRDPRLGDEMGSTSRDFRAQQVSEPIRNRRKTGSHKVSGNAKSSNKTNYSYVVSNGSNPVLGTIAALLFGLVGAGLWAGVGYILDLVGSFDDDTASLIAAVCAFLPTLFVFVGYRIGGDCFDKKGAVISTVLAVIMSAAGACALFVTSEMRWTEKAYGYSVPIDKAIERALQGINGTSTEVAIYGRLLIIAIIIVISLAAGIVVANRKSE